MRVPHYSHSFWYRLMFSTPHVNLFTPQSWQHLSHFTESWHDVSAVGCKNRCQLLRQWYAFTFIPHSDRLAPQLRQSTVVSSARDQPLVGGYPFVYPCSFIPLTSYMSSLYFKPYCIIMTIFPWWIEKISFDGWSEWIVRNNLSPLTAPSGAVCEWGVRLSESDRTDVSSCQQDGVSSLQTW